MEQVADRDLRQRRRFRPRRIRREAQQGERVCVELEFLLLDQLEHGGRCDLLGGQTGASLPAIRRDGRSEGPGDLVISFEASVAAADFSAVSVIAVLAAPGPFIAIPRIEVTIATLVETPRNMVTRWLGGLHWPISGKRGSVDPA
jgi:hypothetical protein